MIQDEWRELAQAAPAGFERWDVVAEPDRDEAEWWAGAPSVARDDTGAFWMTVRMRTADAPFGLRGYEIRIFRSDDGVRFEHVLSIKREHVPVDDGPRGLATGSDETRLYRLPRR